MKARWQQLQPREQQLLLLSGIVVVIIVFYSLLWQPLNSNIAKAEKKLQRQQQLLSWVVEHGNQLKASDNKAVKASGSLTTIVNSTAKRARITVSRMQPKGNSIQLWLNDLSFDQLLKWLLMLQQDYQLHIEAIDIAQTDVDGVVSVRRLQLAK